MTLTLWLKRSSACSRDHATCPSDLLADVVASSPAVLRDFALEPCYDPWLGEATDAAPEGLPPLASLGRIVVGPFADWPNFVGGAATTMGLSHWPIFGSGGRLRKR